jgi:hypothetical protein
MKYEKPELVATDSAMNAIQGSLLKVGDDIDSDCHSGGNDRPTDCPFAINE